jgi:hypothetical protein
MLNKKRAIGLVLIIIGFLLIPFLPSITGNAINESSSKTIGSVLGILFVAIGIALLESGREQRRESSLEKVAYTFNPRGVEDIEKEIKSRRAGEFDDIEKLAKRAGFIIHRGKKHDVICYPDGSYVVGSSNRPVTLPQGAKSTPTRQMYRDILEILYNQANRYKQ